MHCSTRSQLQASLTGWLGARERRGCAGAQTGAGKTYTLSSIQPDAIGMMPRAAAEIFSDIANDPVHEYSVMMSYIQIYMELIQVGPRHCRAHGRQRFACSEYGWWATKAMHMNMQPNRTAHRCAGTHIVLPCSLKFTFEPGPAASRAAAAGEYAGSSASTGARGRTCRRPTAQRVVCRVWAGAAAGRMHVSAGRAFVPSPEHALARSHHSSGPGSPPYQG
jgi:hypothetical protein